MLAKSRNERAQEAYPRIDLKKSLAATDFKWRVERAQCRRTEGESPAMHLIIAKAL